jgi:hypothetical protein
MWDRAFTRPGSTKVAGIFESDPPHVARDKLDGTVAALLPAEEVAEVARYLSLILGLGVDAPTRDRTHLFFAARRLVECLRWSNRRCSCSRTCTGQTGASWTFSTTSRRASEALRPFCSSWLALSFSASGRRGGTGHLAHTTIPLEPLSSTDAATVASHALGEQVLGPTVQRIVNLAEHPLQAPGPGGRLRRSARARTEGTTAGAPPGGSSTRRDAPDGLLLPRQALRGEGRGVAVHRDRRGLRPLLGGAAPHPQKPLAPVDLRAGPAGGPGSGGPGMEAREGHDRQRQRVPLRRVRGRPLPA